MLCTLCQNIVFKPWEDLKNEERIIIATCDMDYDSESEICTDEMLLTDSYFDKSGSLFYVQHPDLSSLRSSAHQGCQFCYQILYGALEADLQRSGGDGYLEGVYLCLSPWQLPANDEEQLWADCLQVFLGQEHRGYMRIRQNQGDEFSKWIQDDHESNTTTGSLFNLNMAAIWLDKCVNCHKDCSRRPAALSPLPLRVLEIGTLDSPMLSLSTGETRVGSYVALSYCWGANLNGKWPPWATLESNKQAREDGIDMSILPKTFVDAIYIYRFLGIKFLWIDSICIIQDNILDWNTQAAEMGTIYSGANLTIAAALGKDSQAGLFNERNSWKTIPCPIEFQYVDENDVLINGPWLACRDLRGEETAYLDTRGWTFQETYLSTRTLRFSASGMHWICASENASEGLPMGQLPFNHKADFDKFFKYGSSGGVDLMPLRTHEKYTWWYRTVEQYSRRQFTKESDRLIALEGLASIFQSRVEDKYMLGIWQRDLLRGLTWRVDLTSQETTSTAFSKARWPSWSWLSQAGKAINYSENGSGDIDETVENRNTTHVRDQPRSEISTPDDAQKIKDWPSPLSGGALKIRGLIRKAQAHSKTGLIIVFGSSCKSGGFPYYDEEVSQRGDLYCLELSSVLRGDNLTPMKIEGSTGAGSLILEKVEGIRFRRVGFLEINTYDVMRDLMPVDLILE